MNSCGFESTGVGAIEYADQKNYHLWNIPTEEVANLYRAFDVFCLPSQGEGFGFPWLEAQASGCPTISVDTTGGKQLNFGGYLIPALEDYYKYSTHNSWFVQAPPSAIDEQLELAYNEWLGGAVYKERRVSARKGALEYDWDIVYDKYWKPIIDKLSDKTIVIPKLPNYGTEIYEEFSGQALMMMNCWVGCKNLECKKLKADSFRLLPGEWAGPSPVLQRSYPVVPDFNGTLLIDTTCQLYKWLSIRFYEECRKYWNILWGYSLIREEIKKLWDAGYFDGKYILLDNIGEIPFDLGYRKAWQTALFTTFQFAPEMLDKIPKGGKILDVGTGEGQRVRYLRSLGYEAVGTEINESWIDNDVIFYGDGLKLPFADNSFDLVSSIDVLEHMNEPFKGLAELFRVSKEWVLLQVTPTDVKEYFEDPTHKVPWSMKRWQRELMEYGDQMIQFKDATFLIRKKKIEEKE